jgi:hypothetical protein
MRAIVSAAILALSLASQHAVAQQPVAASEEAAMAQRQPAAFRVQPTLESVEQGLALRGPPTPTELGLKNVIERTTTELRNKLIICRGC